MHSKLLDAFLVASALPPVGDGTTAATIVAGRLDDYISVGAHGEPILLLSCRATVDLRRPPIVLQHLSVEYGVRYRIRTSTELVEDAFVVVSLRGDDTTLAEPFCLAGEVMLAALPEEASTSDIDRVVRQLVEMMTALSLPSAKSIAGLWAELWLMSVAADRIAAVTAWHGDVTDRFDFAFNSHFVEVKATEREERIHEFALEQLRLSHAPVQVASLRLRRAQRGKSIAELVQALQLGMSRQLREKIVRNVFAAVGAAVSESMVIRFDEAFAEANLRTINAADVPVVVVPAGSPISAVRFRVNLDDSSLARVMVRSPRDRALALEPS